MSGASKSELVQTLGRLSHEIRTALNAVVGTTGLLESTELSSEQREYITTIKAGTDAVLELVDDLMLADAATSVRSDALVRRMERRPADRRRPDRLGTVGRRESRPANGKKLLLVEDNLINKRVITRLLEQLGHEVATAGDGIEAVEAVKAGVFDLVFMDIRMPNMDGFEATRVIRRDLAADRQPWIVALTAAVRPEDREACRDAGADDYLGKPVRTEDLQDAIDRAGKPPRSAA